MATVGIDLGTTNSLLGVMSEDGPVLIPNSLGLLLTPSVVGWDKTELLVGGTAQEFQVTDPERCASNFKRHMGSNWANTILERRLSATHLSALVLQSLKADAEVHLGEPVTHAVITVPAYFNEEQRRATIAAGELAGLNVARILNEPTAAAIAYGLHEAHEEKVAAVIDLGGGTFDISIVEMFEGVLEIRASAGEIFLGGEDFTKAMVSRILARQSIAFEWAEMEHPLMVARLRHQCERAKRLLTRQHTAEVRIPTQMGQLDLDGPSTVVTRDDLEAWTRPILNRIVAPIRRALGDARLKRSDVDEIILVGGATRMPCLMARIEELFSRRPRCSLNPEEVVALGAAVNAGMIDRHQNLAELVVTDVAPFTLGVEVSRELGGKDRHGYFLPIINRNTTIPVSRVERVFTAEPNQSIVCVRVFQGESRMVAGNVALGEFEISGIPRGPEGQPIDIRFTYDLNAVLEVEATIVETKRKATHVFTRHAKGLTEAQLQRALAAMQSIKMHPREEAKNRFLLKRADRLYAELPLRERQLLDSLLGGFEEVLELRDAEAAERFRERIESFLNEYDQADSDDSPSDAVGDW